MSFSAAKAARGIYFCLCLSPLLLSSVCSAEILVEPRVGFHGLFRLGRPFPIEVEIINRGRPVDGTLEVQVWKGGPSKGGAPFPFFYRQSLFLAAQSRKSVQLTIDPDFVSRPLTVRFSTPFGRRSREIDLRQHFSPSPLMLLLSESNTAPSIPLASSSPGRLVSLSLAELPADPRALLGVSHIILYEQSLRDLSRAQTLALEAWLTAGGRLLVLGSLNYALYQDATMNRFLPVRVTGVKPLAAVSSLSRSYGGSAPAIADVWAQASRAVAGKIVLEEQGMPVLVEMSRGRGKVSYLSLDIGRPPLSRWEGLPDLFRDLLGSPGGNGSTVRATWDETVFSHLILNPTFISTYVPTGALFLALLIYLGAMGVLAWLWQKERLSRRTIALALGPFVVFAAAGGHLYFNRGGNVPDGVLFSSTLLESIPDGYVEAESNVALFSTQIRRYRLQVDRGWLDLSPVRTRAGEREDAAVVVEQAMASSRFEFPLREWNYKLFKIRFMDRFPLYIKIEPRVHSIVLKLNNQAAKDLMDCWLVVSGQRFSLGDIPRGSNWTREFPLAREGDSMTAGGGGGSDHGGLREFSFKDRTRDVLFRDSFFSQDSGGGLESRGVVFFGWVKEPDRRVWIEDERIWAYDYTLFRTIIPLGDDGDL